MIIFFEMFYFFIEVLVEFFCGLDFVMFLIGFSLLCYDGYKILGFVCGREVCGGSGG